MSNRGDSHIRKSLIARPLTNKRRMLGGGKDNRKGVLIGPKEKRESLASE